MTTPIETTTLRPLKPTDLLWRGLYGISHGGMDYVVEVDFFDIGEKVRLYRDGALAAEAKSPATFALGEGASIRAAMALYGMKAAELVREGSGPRQLVPLPGTAEARRLGFERAHPALSALMAAGAWLVLAVALVTQAPNLINGVSFWTGLEVPAFGLPAWLNGALSVLGILSGLDRGLRMKHSPLLDD